MAGREGGDLSLAFATHLNHRCVLFRSQLLCLRLIYFSRSRLPNHAHYGQVSAGYRGTAKTEEVNLVLNFAQLTLFFFFSFFNLQFWILLDVFIDIIEVGRLMATVCAILFPHTSF